MFFAGNLKISAKNGDNSQIFSIFLLPNVCKFLSYKRVRIISLTHGKAKLNIFKLRLVLRQHVSRFIYQLRAHTYFQEDSCIRK